MDALRLGCLRVSPFIAACCDLSDGRLRLFSYGPVRVLNQDRERICARRQTAFAECFGGEAPDIDVFALDNVCQWTQDCGVMELGQRDRNPELIC